MRPGWSFSKLEVEKMGKAKKKRSAGPGRPVVDYTQLTPRLHPEELKHLDSVIKEHQKRHGDDEPMHRHEAIRRLVRRATVQHLAP